MTRLDDAWLDRLGELAGVSVGKALGMTIRPMFVAEEGRTFVWCDWSNIEARVLPWLAASEGAERKLDIFRNSDHDKSKPDVYVSGAAVFVHRDPQELWDAYRNGDPEAKKLRQSHGKVPELSLGFGGNFGALMKMAVNYHVHVDEDEARNMVQVWRGANAWAPEFWGAFKVDRHGEVMSATGLWGAANMAIRNPGDACPAGRVVYFFDQHYMGGTLFCALPNGRTLLSYPDCRWREREVKDKVTGEIEVKGALWFRKGYGWSALWHGKLAENITQAVAALILRETLVDLEADEYAFMPVVGHTHDEIVTEVPEDDAERASEMIETLMSTPKQWREGLPLVAEPGINWYYTKAE